MKHRIQAFGVVAVLLFSGSALASNNGGRDQAGQKQAVAEVTDPVCGMKVPDPKAAPRSVYAGKAYYFCFQEDKAKFDKEPEAYLKKKGR